jgi:hypothetical protein
MVYTQSKRREKGKWRIKIVGTSAAEGRTTTSEGGASEKEKTIKRDGKKKGVRTVYRLARLDLLRSNSR